MNNYYFTFGSKHYTNEGIPMRDYWVRVIDKNYIQARLKFIEKFSSVHMSESDKWAFQYNENDFDSSYFLGGEYMLIE